MFTVTRIFERDILFFCIAFSVSLKWAGQGPALMNLIINKVFGWERQRQRRGKRSLLKSAVHLWPIARSEVIKLINGQIESDRCGGSD